MSSTYQITAVTEIPGGGEGSTDARVYAVQHRDGKPAGTDYAIGDLSKPGLGLQQGVWWTSDPEIAQRHGIEYRPGPSSQEAALAAEGATYRRQQEYESAKTTFDVQPDIARAPTGTPTPTVTREQLDTKEKYIQSTTAQYPSEAAFREIVWGVQQYRPVEARGEILEEISHKLIEVPTQAPQAHKQYGSSWEMPTEINPATGKRWTEPQPKYGIQHRTLSGDKTIYDFWTPETRFKNIFGGEAGRPEPGKVYRTDIFGSAYTEIGKVDLPSKRMIPLENPITPKLEQATEMAIISPFFIKYPSLKSLKGITAPSTKFIDPLFKPISASRKGILPPSLEKVINAAPKYTISNDAISSKVSASITRELSKTTNPAWVQGKGWVGAKEPTSVIKDDLLTPYKNNLGVNPVWVKGAGWKATGVAAGVIIQPEDIRTSSTKTNKPGFHTIKDIQKSVFGSGPLMPGNRLLQQSRGLGNRPIMPYERMAEAFLPAPKKETFLISSKKGSYLTGITIPKKKAARGAGFVALEQVWKERAKQNAEAAAKGFTRTRQGQIVLQKQEVKQITKQIQQQTQKSASIQEMITKSMQRTKQRTTQVMGLYVPQIQEQATKLRTRQINYVSAVERMMAGTATRERELTTQRTRTTQRQRTGLSEVSTLQEIQRSMERTIQRSMERTIQRSMERTIQRSMERTIQREAQRTTQTFRPITIQTPKILMKSQSLYKFLGIKDRKSKYKVSLNWTVKNRIISLKDL